MPGRYDFLVFGAGHAGLAFAVHAQRRGARVAVVERARARPSIGEIVEASIQMPLAKLGLWESFLKQRHLRSTGTLSVWANTRPHARNAIRNPFGGGWFVGRPGFDAMLRQAAYDSGVAIETAEARPTHTANGFGVSTLSGNLWAPLAIEATGRHGGAIAPQPRRVQDDLVALAAYYTSADMDLQFRLEAVQEGWWYAAPLPGRQAVATLVTTIGLLPRAAAARSAFWRRSQKETRLIEPVLGDSPRCLTVHPAMGSIRESLHGENWLAIGDAAAAYDPLHGLGIVAALTKGIAAATLLTSTPPRRAFALYADTERATFAAYNSVRTRLYAEAASIREGRFWEKFSVSRLDRHERPRA